MKKLYVILYVFLLLFVGCSAPEPEVSQCPEPKVCQNCTNTTIEIIKYTNITQQCDTTTTTTSYLLELIRRIQYYEGREELYINNTDCYDFNETMEDLNESLEDCVDDLEDCEEDVDDCEDDLDDCREEVK